MAVPKLTSNSSKLKEDESYVGVVASQLWNYTYCLYPKDWRKIDTNQTSNFDKSLGFPLKVVVVVKSISPALTCSRRIIDHQTDTTFWISYDDIFSDAAYDIISKIIFLVNVPFSLDYKLQWTSLSYDDVDTTVMLLNHRHLLISGIVDFARTMKNCPYDPSLDVDSRWYLSLEITKLTYLPHMEFKHRYNNLKEVYHRTTEQRTQKELDSRIARLETLDKAIEMKKMRFAGADPEGSNFLDMCLICRENFLPGSMVSCITHCSHVYHETCLLEWFLKNPSCPYCRFKLAVKKMWILLYIIFLV